mgnify:CR=1 FL=1
MAKKSNLDSPISRVRNDSQTLKKDAKNVKGEDRVIKVSQNIKLESANVKFSERGEQHLYSSDSNKYLLKIHKNGKLVANFYDKGGKTYLHFGDEFFKSIDTNNKYADFRGQDVELNELVLDKKLDVQVKSTNGKDFSCLFSAFGAQIVDTKNGNSVFRNTDYPFDIAVSDRFLERAMGNDNTCDLGEDMKFESATMQALLIASTQNARMRTNQEIKTNNILDNIKRVQPITKNYGALAITSLPIRVPKGEKVGTEWLNLAEKDGKLYGYFNLEVNGRKQVGKYYEVRGMTFENNNLSLKLHAGNMTCNLNMDLKGTGKTVQKFLDSKEKEYAEEFKKFEGTYIDRYDEAKIYSYSEVAVVKRTEKGNELVEEKEPEVVEEDEHGFILVPSEEKDFVLVPPHKVKGKTNEEHGLVVQENEHGLAVQENEHGLAVQEEKEIAVQEEKETGLTTQEHELRTPESIIVEDERYNSTAQAPNAIIENDTVFYQNSPEETHDLESQEPPLHEIQEDELDNHQLEPTNDKNIATQKRKENYDAETSLDGAYFAGGQIINDYTVEYEDGRRQNIHVGKDGIPRTELEEDNQSGLVPREKEPPQNDFGDAENDREREPEPPPREPVPPEPKPHEHDDDDDSGDNEPNHDEQDLTPPVPPHETPDPPHENPDPPHENPVPPHENPDPSPRQETPSGNGVPGAQQAPKGRGSSGGGSAGGGGGSAPKEVKEERIWASFLGVSALLTALSVFIPFLAPFAIAGFATSALLATKPWNWGTGGYLNQALDARARRKELEREDRQITRQAKLERIEGDKARYQQEIESIDGILPQLEQELDFLKNGGKNKAMPENERQEKQQKIAQIDDQIKSEEEEISGFRNTMIEYEDEYIKANKLVLNYSEMLEKSKNELTNYHNQEEELANLQKNVNSILNDKNLSEEEIEKLKQETLNAIQAKYKKAFNDIFSENTEKAKKALDAFAYKTDFDKRVLQSVQENRRGIIRDIESNLNNAKEVEKKAKVFYEKSTMIEKIIKKHETKITTLKDEKAKIQSELTIDNLARNPISEFNRAEAIANVEKHIDALKKRKETLQKAVKISDQMEYGLRPEDAIKNSAFDDRWKNTGPTEKAMKQNRLESERHEYEMQEETKEIAEKLNLKTFADDIINRADKAKKEEDKQKKEEAFNKINDDVNKKEEEVKESMGDAYDTSANKKAFKDLRGIVNDKEKQGNTKETDLRK